MVTKALSVLTLAVVLAACAADVAEESAPTTPTDAPTIAPTPTATPIDVPGEFAAQMLANTQLRSEISGTIQVGDGPTGDLSGSVESVGSDVHQAMAVTFPGHAPRETESITDAGATYELQDGVWIRTQVSSGGSGGPAEATGLQAIVEAALADPDGLELAGTEEIDGERFQRLDIQPAPEITAAMLGFTDPTIADFDATVAFLAEDDGTPAGIVTEATWVQGAEPVDGTLDMRFRFDWGASDVRVTAPENPWVFHASDELGYRMAYPIDWTVRHVPASGELIATDEYLGTVDDSVQVRAFADLQGAPTVEDYYRAAAQSLLRGFGTEPEIPHRLILEDGSQARVMTLHFEDAGEEFFFQLAVIVRGTQAWDLSWYSLAGNETDDGATLLKMLMTFAPAE